MDYHPFRARTAWPAYAEICRRAGRAPDLRTQDGLNALMGGVFQLCNDEISRVAVELRPKNTDAAVRHLERGFRLALLCGAGQNVYSISQSVRDAIAKTRLDSVRLGDIRAPYDYIYLGFEGGTGTFLTLGSVLPEPFVIEGAYIDASGFMARPGESAIEVCLTSRRATGYGRPYGAIDEPHFTFSLRAPSDATFEEALGEAIESGDLYLEHDFAAEDGFRNGIVKAQEMAVEKGLSLKLSAPERIATERQAEFQATNLASAKRGLALVLGALCVLTARRDRDEPAPALTWPSSAPPALVDAATGEKRKTRQKAVAELKARGFAPVRRIDLGADSEDARGPSDGTGNGTMVASHFRAGHFRRQRHGSGLERVKLIWIQPVLVNASAGEPPLGRVYKVDVSSKSS